MRSLFLFLCFLVLFSGLSYAGEHDRIRFLHHSTGRNVYNYPDLGVPAWISDYNSENGTSYQISEQWYPSAGNMPVHYYDRWIANDDLASFTQNYDVIIWKHCFPSSDINPDTGNPDPSSSYQSLENYKAIYRLLRAKMDEYPDTIFIVWTPPPLHRLATNEEDAQRAVQFTNWVKNDWLTEDGQRHPNIYIWDFREIVADDDGLYLKYEHEGSHSSSDSHPNTLANNTAGPQFAQFIVDTIQDFENKYPYDNIQVVSNVSELLSAVFSLTSNSMIWINPGTYNLTNTLIVSGGISHVGIEGLGTSRDDVVIAGRGMSNEDYGNVPHGIVVSNASDVYINNLTLRDFYYHPVQIKGEDGAQSPHLKNLHIINAGEQFVKISNDADNGIVEGCLFEYEDVARSWYTNGVDAIHGCDNWVVRDNTFKNIRSPNQQMAGPAILFWGGCSGTVVERNRIINCDVGISFGNSSGQDPDHTGGIIKNNFIYRDADITGDVGITLNYAQNYKAYHNTVVLNGTFPWTIEYRFDSTTGDIYYNLTDGPVMQRNGGHADLLGNVTNAAGAWFTDEDSGDLHITSSATDCIDQGSALEDVTYDIDGDRRDSSPDIGADEYDGNDTSDSADINQDGSINVQDVQLVVNVILGTATNSRADVDGSGEVNVQDVQAVVNEVVG